MDSLQIYKLRAGVALPKTVDEFGSTVGQEDLAKIDRLVAESDIRATLAGFEWPVGKSDVVIEDAGQKIELSFSPHGLYAQIRDQASLELLRRIARAAGWLILEPGTMQFL